MTLPKVAPWIIAVVASVLAVGSLVWAFNRGRNATRELARVNEERRLELAGLHVAHQVEKDALLQDLLAEATASAKLAEELARIQAAAPGAKPIAVVTGHTAWKPVGPAAGSTAAATPPAVAPPGATPPVPASCPPCRLVAGDELQVRASGAGLMTGLGNVAVAGVASVWRRQPGVNGEELLHEEPLDLDVKIPERAAGPAWGFGPLVGAFGGPGGGGWILGGIVATPSVRLLFGVEGSLVAGGGVGPGGVGGGFLSALLR